MNVKREMSKLKLWGKNAPDMGEPPVSEESKGNLAAPEYAPMGPADHEIVQYNLRIPRWLKKKLKKLGHDEDIAVVPLLERMVLVYERHRQQEAQDE